MFWIPKRPEFKKKNTNATTSLLSAFERAGKLVAVNGPHGSGKATLLRLLGHVPWPRWWRIDVGEDFLIFLGKWEKNPKRLENVVFLNSPGVLLFFVLGRWPRKHSILPIVALFKGTWW